MAEATTTEQSPLVFLRTRDVCKKIGRERSALFALMEQDPTFPRPFKDGNTRQAPNYWLEHEVEAWMREWMKRAKRV
ncbi:helix-turn-helix transcriptional regulator [Halomonas sp. LBP4]|uniref:helix-turn-helix transcriptional regulator n=1 Tax=Halomonas sp. LBP4 TaxID=2044917 RepID=UPI000D771D39|nr:AlpA family phage regulatory protein [Halomonas sp. LBP4]PXX95001.1 transcriptional regulator [Halomonas sp. LBP4]